MCTYTQHNIDNKRDKQEGSDCISEAEVSAVFSS